MQKDKKAVLVVIDGWGIRPEKEGNAIALAKTPHYNRFLRDFPNGALEASGLPVGLPEGVMGNSEVGHMNIGSGRRVVQNQVRINESIASGEFFQNEKLKEAFDKAKKTGAKLQLLGLVSQGNVHSSEQHYLSLLEFARRENLPKDRIFVHVILDGRDTAPKSAKAYLENLEQGLVRFGGRIATVSGRFFTMDRDKRWERTEKGFEAFARGVGLRADRAQAALDQAYARKETDEFVTPTVIVDTQGKPVATLSKQDVVICFNFRADRMRQIVQTVSKNFPSVSLYTFTEYDKTFPYPIIFSPQTIVDGIGETLSKNRCLQFRTAETEKYAHVTYFFNGGREIPFEGEDRLLISSPKVKTYDLQPEMSSREVTAAVVKKIVEGRSRLIVVNFAQPDMVGHTGNFDASIVAVESTDRALGEIAQACEDCEYDLFITADHGNVEMMIDPLTHQPHTAHTTNPVPFICVGKEMQTHRIRPKGALCDVAPTVLQSMNLPIPPAMTGKSLWLT